MKRDLVHNTDNVLAIRPQALTASSTSAAIDLQGYQSAFAKIDFGTITDGTFTPSLNHSDDGTTFTDAGTDGCLQGTFAAALHSTNETSTQRVGYIGSKRYVQVVLTKSGSTTTGGVAAASMLRGSANIRPLA